MTAALWASFSLPVVSVILPSGDWRSAGYVIKQAADSKDNVIIKYGDFVGAILDFLVVALVLFLIVSKIIKAAEGRMAGKPGAPTTKECKFCLETVPIKATRCKACTSELPAT